MDYSAPASSVHGILQARILAWEDPFFRGIFWTQKSNPSILLCRGVLYHLSHHGIPSMVLVLGFLKIFFIKQRTFSTTLRLLRVFIMKSVQSVSSVTQSCLTLCDPIDCSITNSQSLLKLMSIELVMPSNHLILCHPLLPPSIFPSIRIFSNESVLLIRWPKYWSFSFSVCSSNEHQGLISFRMDWLDLRAVQGTLKSLLQHHSSKASILQHSAFFTVQLSHPYMTTGKTIALTIRTFVGKEMSLFFNMLSRLVIIFLPRSKHLSISWLQSPSAVILEPTKMKSLTVSAISPSICHEAMGPHAMILIF